MATFWQHLIVKRQHPGRRRPRQIVVKQAGVDVQRHGSGLTVVTSRGEVMAPWVRVENDVSRDFRSWCAQYGLTPAAEKTLRGPADSAAIEDNPFA